MVHPPRAVVLQAVKRDGLCGGLGVHWLHGIALHPVRIGPMLTADRTQAELKHGLKSTAEVLIEEPVDYRIDAAVEKG